MAVGQDRRRRGVAGSSGPRSRFFYCLVVLLLLLAAACSGEDSGEESEIMMAAATTAAASSSDEAMPATTVAMVLIEEASAEEEAAAERELSLGSAAADGDSSVESSVAAGLAATSPADLGRDVIYTGTISVRAPDVEAAAREAVRIVQGLGGFVFGQQVSSSPEPQSHLTFKVMPADFMPVLDSLSGVGELVDKRITADDVTERIVDFRSRIATAEASVLRLSLNPPVGVGVLVGG